jgi:hypothetical protein
MFDPTMDVDLLIDAVLLNGADMWFEGDELVVRPASRIPEYIVPLLKQYKDEIMGRMIYPKDALRT